MLTADQVQTIAIVLNRCREIDEQQIWSKLDDYMQHLDYLDDHQTIMEADMALEKCLIGNPRCKLVHPKERCLVPTFVLAVDSIVSLYHETDEIEFNNRYILQYFMAMLYTGDIVY